LVMHADVFGPSRCLAQFAAIGVLPKRFCCEVTGLDEVTVTVQFCPAENAERINRVLAKLASLPIMKFQTSHEIAQ
ncbi:MAG: hypothetical protein AAF862_15295, partial [Pseudomonadota bacterium]